MSARFERWVRSPLLLPALLLLGAAISVSRGQDAAWDLKNYHLYNAWAFIHGRLGIDLAAASLQGFFSPLVDLPYFLLGTGPLRNSPRLLAAVQGVWYGALVFVLCQITRRYSLQRGRPFGWPEVTAIVIGATGTMVLSQAGVSTNETLLTFLVLLAFFIAMPIATGNVAPRALYRRAMLAGLMCGIAAGLKPTAIVYAPALTLAAWFAIGSWKGHKVALVLGAASAAGFCLAYGAWGWNLWKLTGNPIFPMFNQVFHSSWMPPTSSTDHQSMPKSLSQALFFPFYWLRKSHATGGNPSVDARYALAMISLLALGALRFARPAGTPSTDRTNHFLVVFIATSYVLWLALYSILRYAGPIEALTGLTMLAAAVAFRERLNATRRDVHAVGIGMTILLVIVLGTTRYNDWGHAPFGKTAFDIHPGDVEPGSLVLMVSAPEAYVIPFLGNAQSSRFIGITWLNVNGRGYGLEQRIRDTIATYTGPMYAVLRDSSTAERALLNEYMPANEMHDCHPISSQIEQTRRRRDMSDGLRICRVIRGQQDPASTPSESASARFVPLDLRDDTASGARAGARDTPTLQMHVAQPANQSDQA